MTAIRADALRAYAQLRRARARWLLANLVGAAWVGDTRSSGRTALPARSELALVPRQPRLPVVQDVPADELVAMVAEEQQRALACIAAAARAAMR